MNKIEIGDVIFTKTSKQILYYLANNIGHLRVIFSNRLSTITNTENYDDIVRVIETLDTRKFIVVDTYKLNDIRFIRLHVDNDKTLSISTDLVAKKIGTNIDIKTFSKLINTLNRKFKHITFSDNNSMYNRRLLSGVIINDSYKVSNSVKFTNTLAFDVSDMESYTDIITLNKDDIMTLINGGIVEYHHIQISIK